MYIIYKNFERSFSCHETHTRSPRGGLTMGRTAEGRSELVKLADDSASSAEATIPSSPRGARSMTESHGCSSLCFERRGSGTVGSRDARLSKEQTRFTLATTLTEETQKSATARPNRAPRDQTERHKTTTEHGPC